MMSNRIMMILLVILLGVSISTGGTIDDGKLGPNEIIGNWYVQATVDYNVGLPKPRCWKVSIVSSPASDAASSTIEGVSQFIDETTGSDNRVSFKALLVSRAANVVVYKVSLTIKRADSTNQDIELFMEDLRSNTTGLRFWSITDLVKKEFFSELIVSSFSTHTTDSIPSSPNIFIVNNDLSICSANPVTFRSNDVTEGKLNQSTESPATFQPDIEVSSLKLPSENESSEYEIVIVSFADRSSVSVLVFSVCFIGQFFL